MNVHINENKIVWFDIFLYQTDLYQYKIFVLRDPQVRQTCKTSTSVQTLPPVPATDTLTYHTKAGTHCIFSPCNFYFPSPCRRCYINTGRSHCPDRCQHWHTDCNEVTSSTDGRTDTAVQDFQDKHPIPELANPWPSSPILTGLCLPSRKPQHADLKAQ